MSRMNRHPSLRIRAVSRGLCLGQHFLSGNSSRKQTQREVEPFDVKLSEEFFEACKKEDFKVMEELARDPRVCLNLQKQCLDGYNRTSLDLCVTTLIEKVPWVEWLIERGAFSFRYSGENLSSLGFSEPIHDGRISCQLFLLAEANNFEEMKKLPSTQVSPNLLLRNKTALDHAIAHDNKEMINYLLSKGARQSS